MFPIWRLPPGGGVADLVTEVREDVGVVNVPDGIEVDCSRGSGGGFKRVLLNRKTPAHLVRKSFG